MSVQEALKHLRKGIPGAFEFDDKFVGISTGSIAVDAVTGIGGFPRGRLSEVFGWEGSGKTMVCLSSCATAQAAGMFAAYVDAERGVDLMLAQRLGFDFADQKRGVYLTPDTFEETLIITAELASSGDVPLIVVDSIPAMVPKDEMEGKIEDTGQLAGRARLLAAALPRITKIIADKNVALVMVNQMRQNIETNQWAAKFAPRERTAGGAALKFYSSLRINLRQVKKGSTVRVETDPFTGKDIEVPIASQHEAEAFKNRVAVPYRKATFFIRFDPTTSTYGIDNLQTVLDLAITAGLVQRKGAFFQYSGPQYNFNTQGVERAYSYLQEHPEVVSEIRGVLKV